MKKHEALNIGENIKRIRKIKGISQTTLGRLSQIPQQRLSTIENNPNQKISIQSMLKIARGLDVSLEELIGEKK